MKEDKSLKYFMIGMVIIGLIPIIPTTIELILYNKTKPNVVHCKEGMCVDNFDDTKPITKICFYDTNNRLIECKKF